jgi:hypothetical protein
MPVVTLRRTIPFALLACLTGCSSSASPSADSGGDAATGLPPVGDAGPASDATVPLSDAAGDASTLADGGNGGDQESPPIDAGTPDTGVGHVLSNYPTDDGGSGWSLAEAISSSPLFVYASVLNGETNGAGSDQWMGISRDGAYVAYVTTRFDCQNYSCLAIANGDGTNGALVEPTPGTEILAQGAPAISPGGTVIVYPTGELPDGGATLHPLDLFAVKKTATGWTAPVLLTADMTTLNPANVYAHDVSISYDGTEVVFDCGISNDQEGPQDTCTAKTDGSGMSILISHLAGPDDGGAAANATAYTHHPDYAPDGTIVFEADWNGGDEQIWRFTPPSTYTVVGSFDDDNTPCVLPDGRIASLWLDRPANVNGVHELKIMNADGSNPIMAVENIDVVDVGESCSR